MMSDSLRHWSLTAAMRLFLLVPGLAVAEDDWEVALRQQTEALRAAISETNGAKVSEKIGPLLFQKGLSEMKLKRWTEAVSSFEACYVQYPDGRGSKNPYHKMALLKWAEAAMGAGEWALAISRFEKFVEERDDPRDAFAKGSYYINLAICYYRLGQLPKGSQNLEIALKNKINFPTPDEGIMAAFQALATTAIESENEQALLDFIRKGRGGLKIRPCEMYPFASVFMKLAGDAIERKMPRAAIALYQFVPSTEVVIDDFKARLLAMGSAGSIADRGRILDKEKLLRDLAEVEADRRGTNANEVVKLAGIAFLHESNGNLQGALAAYLQLERYFPNAGKREDYCINLIRLQTRLGMLNEAEEQLAKFQLEFADSKSISRARELVFTAWFDSGNFAKCVAQGPALLASLPQSDEAFARCRHLFALASFQAGNFETSKKVLTEILLDPTEKGRALEAGFLRAVATARLGDWAAAIPMLEEFLIKYPDTEFNPHHAEAMYELVAALTTIGKFDLALLKADQLLALKAGSPFEEQTLILKGNLHRSLDQLESAGESYLRAYRSALQKQKPELAAGSLCSIVEVLRIDDSKNPSPEKTREVLSYAEAFWKISPVSRSVRIRMALAQIPPMKLSGLGDSALGRLRELLIETLEDEDPSWVDLMSAYSVLFSDLQSAEALRTHYKSFPKRETLQPVVLEKMAVAVIEAHEKKFQSTSDPVVKATAQEVLRELYQELKVGFDKSKMTSKTLILLGDHLRLFTPTPREALGYYDEILSREDGPLKFTAVLGRADVLSDSNSPEEFEKAAADFARVARETSDVAEADYASFRLIETKIALGAFQEGKSLIDAYLHSEKRKFAREVRLLSARCDEKLGHVDEAIANYSAVWKNADPPDTNAAQALERWMQLLWARNRSADRQMVCESGTAFLKSIPPIPTNPELEEARENIRILVESYITAQSRSPTAGTHGGDP